jgi:hypothetical protein
MFTPVNCVLNIYVGFEDGNSIVKYSPPNEVKICEMSYSFSSFTCCSENDGIKSQW